MAVCTKREVTQKGSTAAIKSFACIIEQAETWEGGLKKGPRNSENLLWLALEFTS